MIESLPHRITPSTVAADGVTINADWNYSTPDTINILPMDPTDPVSTPNDPPSEIPVPDQGSFPPVTTNPVV